METDKEHVRLYCWGLQTLVSGLWGAVTLRFFLNDSVLCRISTFLAVTVLVTLCEVCVNKLGIRYQNLSGFYQKLKYGVMFGLAPPDPQSVYENIEKVESPINFEQSVLMVCDLYILTIKLKVEKLKKFVFEEKQALDLLCICVHYSLLLWVGVFDWLLLHFLGTIHIIPYLLMIPVNDALAGKVNDRMREG